MKFLKSILFSLLILPAFSSCAAVFELVPSTPKNTLYVSTNGNDSAAWYGNTNRAWASIKTAISYAHVGDKIIVGPGTYVGDGGSTVTLPVQCKLIGAGTNSTISDITSIVLNGSNEVVGISFTNRAG